MIKLLTYPIKLIIFIPIYFYKWCISPFLKKSCIYYPTCSSYAIKAVKEHGVVAGSALAIRRIGSCLPHKQAGEDYVPINLKGDKKWVF